MITPKLIRAARSLLDWRQEDLALKSGISLPAINKTERGLSSPRKFTLDILQQTFEREGIEFIEGPGLRLTDNVFNIRALTGKGAPILLWDDIVNTLKNGGGEVILSGLDESDWGDYKDVILTKQEEYAANSIVWRALICEGDTKILSRNVSENYRQISRELFSQIPHYVYSDKVAFVLWGNPLRVVVLQHRIMAETYRRQFEMNWKNGKKLACSP
ncbi:MAG: helix-turn-helix transcriptional regulator [Alphaproteobacteria bacterium]|nr:helix-turn-helix transcriptional regulator [Alphaproteobacteria bacterium]